MSYKKEFTNKNVFFPPSRVCLILMSESLTIIEEDKQRLNVKPIRTKNASTFSLVGQAFSAFKSFLKI